MGAGRGQVQGQGQRNPQGLIRACNWVLTRVMQASSLSGNPKSEGSQRYHATCYCRRQHEGDGRSAGWANSASGLELASGSYLHASAMSKSGISQQHSPCVPGKAPQHMLVHAGCVLQGGQHSACACACRLCVLQGGVQQAWRSSRGGSPLACWRRCAGRWGRRRCGAAATASVPGLHLQREAR